MNTKERNSNFELMRIISMFLIVIWHFILHSKLLIKTEGTLNLFLNFIYDVIQIHVNSFILVSGYFQYNTNFKPKKLLSLIGTTWFYKLFYAILLSIFGFISLSKTDWLFFLQPFNYNYKYEEFYWFINMYLALYIISPFINILIKNLSQKQHRDLIITLFLVFSIIPFLTINSISLNNNGYTIINFIMLYIIGAYFGKYKLKDNYHFKYYSNKKYKILILTLFFGSILFSFTPKILYDFLSSYNNNMFLLYVSDVFKNSIINFSSPFVIIESLLYLLVFETLNFKNKLINKIASLTFGIYLVHENYFLFDIIYKYFPIDNINSYRVIKILLYSIIIFTLSALIELGRKQITKLIIKIKNKIREPIAQ